MAALTNATMWDELRAAYPSFASHTSSGTAQRFDNQGWEAINMSDRQAVDEFFNLSIRTALIAVNISHASDRFQDAGFGEYFDTPFAGVYQKMATFSMKPASPMYRTYKDGDAVTFPEIRLPKITDRAFKQNFDYFSYFYMPDDFAKKTIFTGEFGMMEFTAGIFEGFENGYKTQKYLNKIEALNKAINSTTYPVKDTQKIELSLDAEPTADQLVQMVLAVKNVVSAMELDPQSGAYNALGFESTQDRSRLKLLLRPGYKNRIESMVLANAYNQERLTLPIDVIEVKDFGGIQYYTDSTMTTRLYPHYANGGIEDGYSTTEDGSSGLWTGGTPYAYDPNESTIGMIADKGLVFECRQNAYTVEPMRIPWLRNTLYCASSPGNTVAVDPIYNMVLIQKQA